MTNKLSHKLTKLQGRSAHEWWDRAAQALAAASEKHGWSDQRRLPSDSAFLSKLHPPFGPHFADSAALLEHFRTRSEPRFFAGVQELSRTRAAFLRHWPGSQDAIIARAHRTYAGHFDLLGLSNIWFGDPIDWHLEPLAEKKSPLVHWSEVDYLNPKAVGDKKLTWELNRHQHFALLGRAYWLTSDERFAACFVRHISEWMHQNPPKRGINWCSSLELAFRAISWVWALYFFRDSPSLRAELLVQILKYLYLHGRHIETYLSTYFSPNTHLTGEALGLFYLGILFPEFDRAQSWRAQGEKILFGALDQHVRPDGVYFEQSTYYHRYTLDFYTHLYLLGGLNGTGANTQLVTKLGLLADHLMYLTRPDGSSPYLGDDDGGRLMPLEDRPANDFRASLAIVATILGRSDYKAVCGETSQEILWLLGSEGLTRYDEIVASYPSTLSRGFKDAGFYILRDSWESQANYAVIDCGPHGSLSCGHAHADALSLDLCVGGRQLLIDPGTYTYTGSAELRDWFRSSAAHNTLTVDNQSSSSPHGPFSWSSTAECTERAWIVHERFDYFSGEHTGYSTATEAVVHRRDVLFIRSGYFIVRDIVSAAAPHDYALHFHFPSEAIVNLNPGGTGLRVAMSGGEEYGTFCVFGGDGSWRLSQGWVSRAYGRREPAPIGVYSAASETGIEITTFITPHESGVVWKTLKAKGIEAYERRAFGRRDLLLVGQTGALVAYEGISFAGELLWGRFAEEGDQLLEFVLIDGTHLTWGERELFSAEIPSSLSREVRAFNCVLPPETIR